MRSYEPHSNPVLAGKPHVKVANEIARFPDGVTFDNLKRHLLTLYFERTVRDRYLRFYLKQALEEGLVVVRLDATATARFHRTPELPPGAR
jgi:hypothetical protein